MIYVKRYVNIKERFSEVSALRSSNFSSEAQKFLECSRGKNGVFNNFENILFIFQIFMFKNTILP